MLDLILMLIAFVVIWLILMAIFMLIVDWIENIFSFKKKKTSTSSSSNKKSSRTTHTAPSSSSINQSNKPKTITSTLELFYIYVDDELLLPNMEYYAIKSTDLKISYPVIKIFNQDHQQIGVMNLQDSALQSRKFKDRCAYKVSITNVSKQNISITVHLDQLATQSVYRFEFVEPSTLPSEEAKKAWVLSQTHATDSIEHAELAYLGPNWSVSDQTCSKCQSHKYQIDVHDLPILVEKHQRLVQNFSTCLTCEIIENEQYFWQAASDSEYNARTQYISTKS